MDDGWQGAREIATKVIPIPWQAREHDDASAPGAALVTLVGPYIGRRFPFPTEAFVIGRTADCEISFDQASMSRRHARVKPLPGNEFEIVDLDSRNGTFVNDRRVNAPQLLRAGDRIRLGPHVSLQFVLEDRLDRQLAEAQKMEAIGLLSAGISHDFNNLLTVMQANTSFLQNLPHTVSMKDADVVECLQELQWATTQATGLTKRLATFVRRDDGQSQIIDLAELTDELTKMLRRVLPSAIRLESSIHGRLVVKGSRACLYQLFMNPCINARDAMPGGGVLRIDVREATTREVLSRGELENGAYVLVSITDDGVGMDEETQRRVFTPLFTTKQEGAGTGLGMATVARIAREHGGHVEIESAPGRGTTLRVFLPSVVTMPRARQTRVTGMAFGSQEPPPRPLDVLFVDDEPLVRSATTRVLEADGHSVQVAADGADAVDRFKSGPMPDVVILDIDMPNMDGIKCFAAMRAHAQDVRVVFLSGQQTAGLEQRIMALGARAFIRKPYGVDELVRVIRLAAG